MRKLSITNGDAFILVYSLDNEESFEEVKKLRQQILDTKANSTHTACGLLDPRHPPIVIVGNKLDLWKDESVSGDKAGQSGGRDVPKATVESLVNIDWNHGYVEASAKSDININGIFKELLAQAKVQLLSSPALVRKRRQSLPAASCKGRGRKDSCRVS